MLRYTITLSIEEKALTVLTIEDYVDMEEQFWQCDCYNYVYEGCCVDFSAWLKMCCYTSARLQEIARRRKRSDTKPKEENKGFGVNRL